MQGYHEIATSRPSSVTDVHLVDLSKSHVYNEIHRKDKLGAAHDSTFILDSNDYCAIQRVMDGAESLNRIAVRFCAFNAGHPLLMGIPALSNPRGITRYLVTILGGSSSTLPIRRLSHLQFDALMGNLTHALIQNQVSPLSVSLILRNAERTRKKLVAKHLPWAMTKGPCVIL
ncbi:hypothetical protein DSO57_1021394 [Entomophthora muscae]|uniref:Uncharacterized protein n=1 Tax=Entomophthora muscae TaxID=34485 RepID=A0ACC2S5G1_9FUNG|nr:hypothetical protein DSO57_1021394 [Entomophthora muscae]